MEKKHIVIVDDDVMFCVMLRKILEVAGYSVSEVRNALGVYGLGAYDLMLLDLKLPGIDGHKVLASLKEDKNARPIIVITGLSDPNQEEQALAEGADGFMTKPLNTQELLSKITELLARTPA